MRNKRDVFYLLSLLVLVLLYWSYALLPGNLLFVRDLSVDIIPKRSIWLNSHGFALWTPYLFFGSPFAANGQSEAFYPLNFIYSFFGLERGLTYYIVFQHALFLLTLYAAFRRVKFDAETSLIGAVGFGFGGFMASLSHLVIILSTVAWMPLSIIILSKAAEKNGFKWSLVLGPVLALQILAGEVQFALMSWLIAMFTVLFSPQAVKPRDAVRLAGAMGLGLLWGIIFSLPQSALSAELTALSNRAAGFNLKDALFWPLTPSGMKSLLVANYLMPTSVGIYWGLGSFSDNLFFSSCYLGVTMAPMVLFSFAGARRWKPVFWLAFGGVGLAMMLGDALPVYKFFYEYLPGFKLFRSPGKFLFFLNYSWVMLAMYGCRPLFNRTRSNTFVSIASIAVGLLIAVLLIAQPVRVQEFGNKWNDVISYLFLRSILREMVFFMILAALLFLGLGSRDRMLKASLALIIGLDLMVAHFNLNPVVKSDFYQPNASVKDLLKQAEGRKYPVRIASLNVGPLQLPTKELGSLLVWAQSYKDELHPFWPSYFGLNDIGSEGTFYVTDFDKFGLLNENKTKPERTVVFERAGIEDLYIKDVGFIPFSLPFPRASIFYNASAIGGQDKVLEIWSQPNFPALETLLMESGGSERSSAHGVMSEPAKITGYENEKVVIEADARRDGWLLLLDSYYPGWEATVDGKPAPIYRADGFFRAVPVPAGKHMVTFSYFPKIFQTALWISGIGFLFWIALLVFSSKAPQKRVEAGN
jgi:hypothetical protein